jgi:hypothetical protein
VFLPSVTIQSRVGPFGLELWWKWCSFFTVTWYYQVFILSNGCPNKYCIYSRNLRPRVFAHPNFWRMILDLFLLRLFHAPPYCSFTSNLTTCFTVLVQLAPQHEVLSRTHRSTINWIFTVFSLIIDCWIHNGIYSAIIMIIINLIIDKSRLCYKITIKYWQNVPYSQLY